MLQFFFFLFNLKNEWSIHLGNKFTDDLIQSGEPWQLHDKAL